MDRLTKIGEVYERVRLEDAIDENGEPVKIIRSRETLTDDDLDRQIAELDEQIANLQGEKANLEALRNEK